MIIAVSGIDTGIGKTIATGLLARALLLKGRSVITQKAVQTGCEALSDDIVQHRELMGIGLQEVDRESLTCPLVFAYPASPHLAAAMEHRRIDPGVIAKASKALQRHYQIILLEGAGGLMVPLNDELLFIDYLAREAVPLILVTSSRLGSINHTLLSLEACRNRKIVLRGLLYNRFGGEEDAAIAVDTRRFLERSLSLYDYRCPVVDLPDAASDLGQSGLEALAALVG